MKYEEIYKKLKEKYTDEEIVDSMLIPADLSEQERKELDKEMREIRMQKLREMTEEVVVEIDDQKTGVYYF